LFSLFVLLVVTLPVSVSVCLYASVYVCLLGGVGKVSTDQ